MIVQPTVLVLGAGASHHLEYPLGSQLKHEIVTALGDPGTIVHQMVSGIGYSPENIRALHEALFFSGKQTVDAFLEHRQEFLNIGKAAIAARLVQCERLDLLFGAEFDWYAYLYARMNTTMEEFAHNKLTIVTFNYDRSLEAFLFLALKNSYGNTDPEVAEAMRSLPIVHVHGSLGPLPWQEIGGRDYTTKASPEQIKSAAASIRVVHEGGLPSTQFELASKCIRAADRVVFLGFGYDRTSLARLNLDITTKSRYWGSTYRMTALEKRELRTAFGAVGIDLGAETYETLGYLRNAISL